MATLPERLRHIRRSQGLTQKQLQHKSGVPHNTISRIETGEAADITTRTLIALALALNVSTDYLLGLTDGETRTGETDASGC